MVLNVFSCYIVQNLPQQHNVAVSYSGIPSGLISALRFSVASSTLTLGLTLRLPKPTHYQFVMLFIIDPMLSVYLPFATTGVNDSYD